MKNNKRIILTAIMLVFITILGFSIYAALTDTKEKGPVEFEMGNLSYSVTGNIEANYLYPGKNIVTTSYKITNSSTIDTEIRISLRFYFGGSYITPVELADYVEEEGFDFNLTDFTLTDGFYYYDGIVTPDITEITLFTKIIFDGWIVRNEYESTDFKVELTFHAKQKDNVSWTSLGSKFI